VWRVKSIGGEEFPASPFQGEYVVRGDIVALEVCITIEEENEWMPNTRKSPFQLLPTIFQKNFSFLNIC
jgi:hypothetical protein